MLEDPAGPGHHGSCATSADNNEDGSNGSWMRWPQSRARVISITGGYDRFDMKFPRGLILIVAKYAKSVFRLAPDLALDRIQPTGQSVAGRRIGGRSRDKKRLEIGPSEGARRDIFHRHVDHAINLAIRSDSNDTSAIIPAVPQIAFGIHGRPVRNSTFEVREEDTLIRNRPGGAIIVVRPNRIHQRISEIETPPVRAPGQRVGDANLSPGYGHACVGIDPTKDSILSAGFPRRSVRVHVVAHRAHPQRTTRIDARVIEADGRPSLQVVNGFVAKIRGGLPQNHAGAKDHRQHVIAVGQRDRGYRLIEKPGAAALVRQCEAINHEAIDVGPVNRGMRRMPDHTFAAAVAGRRHANWLRCDGSRNYCTPMPASRPPSTR